MTKMRSFLLMVTVLAIGAIQQRATATAVASSGVTEAKPHHLTRRELIQQLQLTEDQKKLLHKSRAAYLKKLAEIDGQIKVARVELETELEKTDPDMDKIDGLTSQIGQLYGQRINVRVKAQLNLEKNILTPEQVEKLKALESETNESEDIELQN